MTNTHPHTHRQASEKQEFHHFILYTLPRLFEVFAVAMDVEMPIKVCLNCKKKALSGSPLWLLLEKRPLYMFVSVLSLRGALYGHSRR